MNDDQTHDASAPGSDADRRAVRNLLWVESFLAQGQWASAEYLLRETKWPAPWRSPHTERLATAREHAGQRPEASVERHVAQWASLRTFRHDVPVRCPRCAAIGVVTSQAGRARFTCSQCTARITTWQGPMLIHGVCTCPQCGGLIEIRRPTPRGHTPRAVEADCPGGHVAQLAVHGADAPADCPGAGAHRRTVHVCRDDPYSHDPPLDPDLGLELALATKTRHGWVWALNHDHLEELRAFVAARVRVTSDYQYQWANRLPRWIIDGHHRREVLAALRKLG